MSVRAILDDVAEIVGFHPYYSELDMATEKSYVDGDNMISLSLSDEGTFCDSMRQCVLTVSFSARTHTFKYKFDTSGFSSCGNWGQSYSACKLTEEQLRASLQYILHYCGFYFDDNEDYVPYDKKYLGVLARRDELCDSFAVLSVDDF